MIKECLENVRKNVPLVHNITNYVTVNDVAKCHFWRAVEVLSCRMMRVTWRISQVYVVV